MTTTNPSPAADMTSFTSGRPDWDAPQDAGGVIDLHVCLTAEAAGDLNAVARLTAQLAQTLCTQVQQIAPGATVHTGLRNKMWDHPTSQPAWGERLFHAEVNRLFANMATAVGADTAPAGSPSQSGQPQPLALDRCSEISLPGRAQPLAGSGSGKGRADSAS